MLMYGLMPRPIYCSARDSLSDVRDHVNIYKPVIFSTGDRDVPRSAMFLYCITILIVQH